MEQLHRLSLIDLENLILQLGYSKSTAVVILNFLRSRGQEGLFDEELETTLLQLQDFVDKRLKPRYLARAINHLFALVNITVELREDAFYFSRHLFDPEQENARLSLEYLRMQRLGPDTYSLELLEGIAYVLVYPQLSFKEALDVLMTDPKLAP